MATIDLGVVTAYAYAVAGGYTGSEQDFEELLGNIATDLAEIENLSVTVTTLPAGSQATASYNNGVLSLGIPKGDKGDTGETGQTGPTGPTGNGIQSIAKTATSGAVHTYTITFTDGTTTTFDVTDGEVTTAVLDEVVGEINTRVDALAKSEIETDLDVLEAYSQTGRLLEMMDYGDQLDTTYNFNNSAIDCPVNLVHTGQAELEGGSTVNASWFEWEYATPTGIPFDEPEAIFESDSVLAAGTYNFTVVNDSWGGNNNKTIQFTLTSDLPAGYQIRKSVAYNALVTSGVLNIYDSASSRTALYSVTPTEGSAGTSLGSTDGTGDLNHWHRVALGDNRWVYSFLRQWLNTAGAKGTYYEQTHKWDVKPSQADSVDGFLYGYSSDLIAKMKKIKVGTASNRYDNYELFETYDRVFPASLEQLYIIPERSGEGDYWEYYKNLLGTDSPVARGQTYTELIKYGLNAKTSAVYCEHRSAYVGNAYYVWYVYSSGSVGTDGANDAGRPVPCFVI